MSRSRRCLVTGGAGFIGSHVVDKLLEDGQTVAVVDDFSSGKRHFLPEGVELFEQSVTEDLDTAFTTFKPNAVFHLAAQISVSVSTRKPIVDADLNILGSINVLEAAVRHGVDRVIYASSGAAYGDPVTLPMAESHPLDAISPYGISKSVVERYLYYYRVTQGLESVALRYANVYGPRQDPHGEAGVVAIFNEAFVAERPCAIYGDGLQTRDFVYVKDVAEANRAAFRAELTPDSPRIFNVSTGKASNINDVYDIIRNGFGSDREAIREAPRPGDARHSILDSSLIQETLGWRPKTDVRDGLTETAEYFKAGGTARR